MVEQKEFRIPNQVKPPRPFASQEELRVPEILRTVALHYVIRDEETSPYARRLRDYENIFAEKERRRKRVKDEMVQKYLKVQIIKIDRRYSMTLSTHSKWCCTDV